MTPKIKMKTEQCGHRILTIVILCLFGLSVSLAVSAQAKNKKKGDKVYIDHADNLRMNQYELPNVQIAKGNVKFRYKDMTLLCDSAFLNERENTFQAFGHVDLKRKDGTHLNCSRAYYEGFSQMMRARGKVHLRKGNRSLRCDSLDYDMASNVGNYFGGRGTLVFNGNTVVADKGDYNTETHDANFYDNVVIFTPKYKISTPTAHGNTETGLMHVVGKSVIRTRKGEVINTNDGTYNSITDHMELQGFSTIKSRERDVQGDNIIYNSTTGEAEGHGNVKIVDKVNNRIMTGNDITYNSRKGYTEGFGNVKIIDNKENRTIIGDHVIYNSQTGHSEGHGNVKIVDRAKMRTIVGDNLVYNSKSDEGEGNGNVYYLDEKRKHAFQGDYVHYTDSAAIAYGGTPGPVAKEFSKGDTLFVHADTISMKGFNMNTPEMYRELYGVNNVRAFRTDIQAICGFLIANSRDSCMTMYQSPIVWTGNRQMLGDSIKVFMNDSTIRKAYLLGNASSIEEMEDKIHYNQVYSKRMNAYFEGGNVRWGEAIGNVLTVFFPIDDKDSTLMALNYLETDTLRAYMRPDRKLEKIWTNKFNATAYPMTQIPPDKLKLRYFKWYIDMRPRDKFDIFRRVGREGDADIAPKPVAAPPRQTILN
ncbi:UNVERIFIED_CONTAM: hypothetical protein NY100_08110 [Prevotella sp. 15_C9]